MEGVLMMSVKENEKATLEKEPKEIKSIESLDLGGSGMVCDFDTGICGPVNEEKEDKK